MSKSILIIGESGSGKTTSLRNLPPEKTFYVDCDLKGLSWKGWRNDYNKEQKNYIRSTDKDFIMQAMSGISQKTPEIKYFVIDTLNAIMIADEMRRSKEKGYDKWIDLATAIYDVIQLSNSLREDLIVICLAHAQVERDDLGNVFTRMKTSGRKLDKIVPESFFTNVLLAKRDGDGNYIYEVKSNNSTAKTPMGMFDVETIENDIMKVIKEMEEF